MLILMLLDCKVPGIFVHPLHCSSLSFMSLASITFCPCSPAACGTTLLVLFGTNFGRFRDKPDVFANQARQCAILSTSSAMLYDTPGQEDEDSGLRFGKITKEEYNDILSIARGMWERKHPKEQTS